MVQSFALQQLSKNLGRKKMKSLPYKKANKGDVSILIITAMLALFGVVMVYSASSYNAETQYGDQFFFMKKQLLGF